MLQSSCGLDPDIWRETCISVGTCTASEMLNTHSFSTLNSINSPDTFRLACVFLNAHQSWTQQCGCFKSCSWWRTLVLRLFGAFYPGRNQRPTGISNSLQIRRCWLAYLDPVQYCEGENVSCLHDSGDCARCITIFLFLFRGQQIEGRNHWEIWILIAIFI